MNISAIILTKNEEKNIERCLNSLSFCQEIIVIDDSSSDKTEALVKTYNNATFTHRELLDDFSLQRNYAFEQAKGDWILFIDADEVVSRKLGDEIRARISENENNAIGAYYIKRRDFFWGRELKFGETQKVRNNGIIRLVKKQSGKWYGKVHERFQLFASQKLSVARLKECIDHYPHQTIKEFIQTVNRYSTLRAKELYSNNVKTNILQIILFPFGKFFLTYFLRMGFRDGAAGFAYAFFMSFHSFLVRSKLWQYYHTKDVC